ncbi:hypothetical protein ATANTOWER_007102 [Ataeniobius toweri]|uniref:Uncharacterized protein n=1 Tax=Ataeniobius toweri TaxID=208326 RepID=A0ABU7B573_9TELE|nr:hypothetical protein [Ataeniobius toweri]
MDSEIHHPSFSHHLCSWLSWTFEHGVNRVMKLVALLPCSKKDLGSTPGRGSFYMELACSPRACMGSHRVLWLPPKNMTVR